MNIFKGWRDAAAQARDARTKVDDMIADVRARIAETAARLFRAEDAPVTRGDMKVRARALRKKLGDHWITSHGGSLVRGEQTLGVARLLGDPILPWTFNEPIPFGALCAGLPEVTDRFFDTLIEQVEYEEGLPLAERPRAVERLRSELAKLEGEEEQMIVEALDAGLPVERRPEVIASREAEERQRVREARAAAEAARIAAANREVALVRGYPTDEKGLQPPRDAAAARLTNGGRSEYLDGQRARLG